MALKNIKNHSCNTVTRNGGILKTDQVELVAKTSAPSDSDLADSRIYYDSTDTTFYGRANSSWVPLQSGTERVSTVTGTTTLTSAYTGLVLVRNGATSITLTLPSAATEGLTFTIKKVGAVNAAGEATDVATSVAIKTSTSTQSIEAYGAVSTYCVRDNGDFITLVADGGSTWYVVSRKVKTEP